MLTTSSKVYYVYKYGGEYEDKWEHPVGVCSSLELAQELKSKTEAIYNVECIISENEYSRMIDYLYDYEEEHGEICTDEIEGLAKLFPQYNIEDLKIADKKYFSYDDFGGVDIKEVDFYN